MRTVAQGVGNGGFAGLTLETLGNAVKVGIFAGFALVVVFVAVAL